MSAYGVDEASDLPNKEEQINKNTFIFDRAQSGDLEGMAPNRNSVVRTSAYGADEAGDLPNSEVVQEYPQVACLQTPCVLDGERVIAFVDSGATDSFVSQKLV
jgi:hypothetical protein